MKIKLQHEINLMDGSEPTRNYVETEMEDPVFLNMQFCIEREHFEKLLEVCSEYKLNGIHQAIDDILQDPNPYTIIDQNGP